MSTSGHLRKDVGRVLRGLASTALLVALVLGSPAALTVWGRIGELRGLSLARLTAPDDGSVLLGLATLVGWAAWLVFTVCVLVEAVDLASGSRVRLRVPGLGQVQGLAAGLLVASIALIAPVGPATSTGQPAAISRTLPVDDSPAQDWTAGSENTSGTASGRTWDRSSEALSVGTSGTASEEVVQRASMGRSDSRLAQPAGHSSESRAGVWHRVTVQDSMWSLAEHWYGDGTAWRRIVAGNPGLDPANLPVGQIILIPGVQAGTTPAQTRSAPTPDPSGAAPASPPTARPARALPATGDRQGPTIVVVAGDTLSGLAQTHLGDADRWPEIWSLNRDQISDPDLIDIGWRLRIPAVTAPAKQSPPSKDAGDAGGTPSPAPSSAAPDDAAPNSTDSGDAGPETSRDADTDAAGTDAADAPSRAAAPDAGSADPEAGTGGGEASTGPTGSAQSIPGVPSSAESGDHDGVSVSPIRGTLAGLSLFLAGGIAGALVTGRRRQLFSRPVGRRVPVLGEDAAHLRAALDTAADAEPEALPDPDPGDDPASSGSHEMTPGTVVLGTRSPDAQRADGGIDADEPVLVDLAATSGWFGVAGSPEDARAMVAGIALSLTCAWWSEGLEVVACGDSLSWLARTGSEAVTIVDHDEALEDLSDLVSSPHPVGPQQPVLERVLVMDVAPVGLPDPRLIRSFGTVIVSPVPGDSAELEGEDLVRVHADGSATLGDLRFTAQLVGEPVRRGVLDLVATTSRTDTEPARWWNGDDPDAATGRPESQDPADQTPHPDQLPQAPPGPHQVGPPPWSPSEQGPPGPDPDEPDPPESGPPSSGQTLFSPSHSHTDAPHQSTISTIGEVTVSHRSDVPDPDQGETGTPATPMLRLLGPVDLIGARGPEPARSVRQCVEYCAWILDHPGSGSARMREGLMVAEPTRRSNTSRLRRWLGRDDEGRLYLPDAYDGRIRLNEAVGTDWEILQLLISGGIAAAADRNLRAALDLVRGSPLADAAPGQWHWAEEWRVEMMQTVRDIGIELARRAIDSGDLDTARLALARALVCCPEDEELLVCRIRLADLAGERSEVERLVYLLSRRARKLGVDLSEETVVLLQEVMEGRPRARVV